MSSCHYCLFVVDGSDDGHVLVYFDWFIIVCVFFLLFMTCVFSNQMTSAATTEGQCKVKKSPLSDFTMPVWRSATTKTFWFHRFSRKTVLFKWDFHFSGSDNVIAPTKKMMSWWSSLKFWLVSHCSAFSEFLTLPSDCGRGLPASGPHNSPWITIVGGLCSLPPEVWFLSTRWRQRRCWPTFYWLSWEFRVFFLFAFALRSDSAVGPVSFERADQTRES